MKCELCKILFFVIFIILLSLFLAYQFVDPPPPQESRIATGGIGGGYHTFALEYKKRLAEQDFQLEIQPTAGSIEVLQKLTSGDVSVGLVQGGTKNTGVYEGLESLASLFYEPVWVFHRKEQSFQYLFDLRGKRVAVGLEGSGTRPIALQLLENNHVTQDNTTFLALSSKTAAQQLASGKIDAAFFVMSPTASIIIELLKNPNIELMSFKRHLAYSSRYPFLTSVQIGEGMIDLENNIPNQDKTLLAATASLVARKDLHPDIVYMLLKTVVEVHKKGGLLEKTDQFPSAKFVEFPMNPEAEHYLQHGPSWLQKIFSFRIASTLDRLKIMLIPLIVIMLPLLKGALPLYRWGIRFKIFRWYGILRDLDSKISSITELSVVAEEIQQMKGLQKELIEQVSVPLSYMGEFYTLQMHIQLVLTRLENLQQEMLASENAK